MLKSLIYYINRGYLLLKNDSKSIALYGGSFDPPHLGHKSVVEEALKVLPVDKLFVIPTFLNPFKSQSYFSESKRFELVSEMFASFERVEISDYEISANRAVTSVETLRYFQQEYEVDYLIIGADNLEKLDQWSEFEYLNAQVTWVIARRNGYGLKSDKLRDFKVLNTNVDISSTQIRNRMTKENG
ncbi:MAG TPA: nicotinate (nicotinamide) nucleotide adenylyltransferase [Campylobacterales bacterium]|nr:nicotinate (nicotinamide) nucleotide adenylyltransferase [Campylobacterales bacterium]HHS93416.1 nicotinate (nicotinamide) nucleotide adenylyltransferase [Campylobacterales bacterium]